MIRPFRWEASLLAKRGAPRRVNHRFSFFPPFPHNWYDHDAARQWRDPRSLLETIRAFRSQINSLSRLWLHPRGVAGSQGDSRAWNDGGAGQKHHDHPTRRTHAVTPADHNYTRALDSRAVDHPRRSNPGLPVLRIVVSLLSRSNRVTDAYYCPQAAFLSWISVYALPCCLVSLALLACLLSSDFFFVLLSFARLSERIVWEFVFFRSFSTQWYFSNVAKCLHSLNSPAIVRCVTYDFSFQFYVRNTLKTLGMLFVR